MNQYRTDLAIECQEILDESAGIQMEKIEYNGGIHVTRIKIISQEAAKKMGKPVGSYITLEAEERQNSFTDMMKLALETAIK